MKMFSLKGRNLLGKQIIDTVVLVPHTSRCYSEIRIEITKEVEDLVINSIHLLYSQLNYESGFVSPCTDDICTNISLFLICQSRINSEFFFPLLFLANIYE